jgi:hypothetical protein
MTNRYEYQPLCQSTGDIRLLRILPNDSNNNPENIPACHIFHTSLLENPKFVALSYVWGDTKDSPSILLDDCSVDVTRNLYDAIMALRILKGPIIIWIDFLCIDQQNYTEKEQQVQLMSKIYKHAQQVIGWLGDHDNDSHLVFNLFVLLGRVSDEHNRQTDLEWRLAAEALIETGHLYCLEDLFDPNRRLIRAAALLVQRPWFRRLWIVQEVTLASSLELRCGFSSIPGDVFFKAIRMLSSVVTSPPMPWLLKPYRRALKLGQLRAQASIGHSHSFPHLAQILSGWDCSKSHDRLIALFGLVFKDTQAWLEPNYGISGPEFYTGFAERHIRVTGGLGILHFAGCGDSDAHTLSQAEDRVLLQVNPPADDIASWVPDWRVQSRPLTLSPDLENAPNRFAATESISEHELKHHILHVRAQKMDKIVVCGLPYYESLRRRLKITEMETFNHWFILARAWLKDAVIEPMFASTLVMDGKVAVEEREDIGVNSTDVPSLFRHWASRNIEEFKRTCEEDWKDGIQESTKYGYIAEEICRNRTFFITEAGRLGLGSVHISAGDSIYLIHGLKSPFVVRPSYDMHILHGECYVHSLMDGRLQRSDQDCFLHLK